MVFGLLLVVGSALLAFLVLFVGWRLFGRQEFPECTCFWCGRRRPAEMRERADG